MLKSKTMSFILLILFLGVSVLFTMVNNSMKPSSPENTIIEEKVGLKGLPYGVELSQTILLEDDLYIYYEDRIVEKYFNDSSINKESIERINLFFNSLPDSIHKTISLTPMAITYENVKVNQDSIEAQSEIKEGLNSNINWIDIHPIYESKKEEYLYFRTDPRITSLAAYYIAQEFLSTKGINIIPLSDYREDRRAKVSGIYMYLPGSPLNPSHEDTVVSYFLDGATNHQLVTTRKSDDVTETFESPTIAISRRGLDIFVESNLSDSILYGDGTDNTIIVIGDYNAKVVSTWLTPYYEHVIVINSAFYTKSQSEFFELFETYNITDVLLAESIKNIGDSSENSKLKRIYE